MYWRFLFFLGFAPSASLNFCRCVAFRNDGHQQFPVTDLRRWKSGRISLLLSNLCWLPLKYEVRGVRGVRGCSKYNKIENYSKMVIHVWMVVDSSLFLVICKKRTQSFIYYSMWRRSNWSRNLRSNSSSLGKISLVPKNL